MDRKRIKNIKIIMNLSNFSNEFKKILNRDYFLKELNPHRKKAFSKFKKIGFPTKKWENWRFTNVNEITDTHFKISELEDSSKSNSQFDLYKIDNLQTIVIYNGHYQNSISNLPDGVLLFNGIDYLKENEYEFDQLSECPFNLLNTAFVDSGINIIVKKNCIIKEPIRILFISNDEKSIMVNPRVNINLGQSSSITIVEHHVGNATSFLQNESVFISLDSNSQIDHIRIQSNSQSTNNIANINIKQNSNSNYKFFQYADGSRLSRSNIIVDLDGQNSNCEINFLSLSNNKQHIDNNILINHNNKETYSSQFVKSILLDFSTGVFSGKTRVKDNAQKIVASQINKNLILSKNAKMNSIPQLEIYTDDVKCSHGSTTGQIDDEALFYLQSRGINKSDAIELLVEGFANEAMDKINNKIIKRYLLQVLSNKFDNILN